MEQLGLGRHYFEEVIEPNAYVFPDESKYLPAPWGSGGIISQPDFQAMTSHFIESGWTLDASAYVGFSGGEGVDIFGMGSSWSFRFLVGGTYSQVTTDSGSREDAWASG